MVGGIAVNLFGFQEDTVLKLIDLTTDSTKKQTVVVKAPTGAGRATARKNQENLLKITLDKNSSSKEHLKRLALRLNLTEVKDL